MTEKFKDLFAEGYRARRENRLPASRAIFIDAVRKAAEDGDRSSLAEALSGLAQAEDDIGNCEAARHHYANAAVLYREVGPPKMLAHAIRHEADILMQMKQPAEAEPLYLEAEKIYRQNGEEGALDLAHTLRGMALMKEATGELEASRSLWREAREIYARRDAKGAVAECDRKLSLPHQDPV
jgi:tetratricopeptide (TPR) repeat protein